jgi:hypothetical protein
MNASIVKTTAISVGLSVSRVKSGEIVFSAHQGEQRILFEATNAECAAFVEQIQLLLRETHRGKSKCSPSAAIG